MVVNNCDNPREVPRGDNMAEWKKIGIGCGVGAAVLALAGGCYALFGRKADTPRELNDMPAKYIIHAVNFSDGRKVEYAFETQPDGREAASTAP